MMAQSPRGADDLLLAAMLVLDRQPSGASTAKAKTPHGEADARAVIGAVTVEAYASRRKVRPGQTFQVAVALDIDDGWHLYGPNPDVEFVIPTTVQPALNNHFRFGKVQIPEGRTVQDAVLNQKLEIYEGRVWLRVPVTVLEGPESGVTSLTLNLRRQACDDNRCQPPQTTTLDVPITVDPQAPVDEVIPQ